MIAHHEINSRWWDGPVGTVIDPEFFNLPKRQQQLLLNSYDWVEFKAEYVPSARLLTYGKADFDCIDVQIEFRVPLGNGISNSERQMVVQAASENPFCIDPMSFSKFNHERFHAIPGVTDDQMRVRYATWARQILAEHPQYCLQVLYQGKVQGWFLSQLVGSRLQLTLAMVSTSPKISGTHLYSLALNYYGTLGHRVGVASFSIRNHEVHNIYANLGAKFTRRVACYLWVSEHLRKDSA